jgi:hypothetical protein
MSPFQELKALPQWVAWKKEIRDGKETKIPVNPRTGGQAAVDKPSTWGTYEVALAAARKNGNAGIGFVFTDGDPFTGIDLDDAIDAAGVHPQALEVIKTFNSYTEKSQSGHGLHIIIKGKLPPGGRRKGKLEIYDNRRFFVMTGAHLEDTPTTIENRQAELEAFHKKVFGKPQAAPPKPAGGPGPVLDLTDFALIDKAKSATNGHKFCALWGGDTTGYLSPSEATAALCLMLAYWTDRDPGRMDRLFRESGLMRDKWDRPQSGSTWGALEIQKAIARTPEGYNPGKRPQDPKATPTQEPPKPSPQAKAPPAIRFVSGKELEALDFPEPVWIILNILVEGYILLAGRPKLGKSWLALCLAVAVAMGGCALGRGELRAAQGKVLYLALEDRLRRIKNRLRKILGGTPFPENLLIAETWNRLDKGGLDDLKEFLKAHDDCRLVVIDTLAKVRPPRGKNADPYEFDMLVGGALQSLANQFRVSILVVHHTRKSEADDPLDTVSGTTGITGAADAVMILKRGRGQADGTLSLAGRDISEQELALKFRPEEGAWELMGDAAEYAKSQERLEIIKILREHGPKTPKEIAEALGKKQNNTRALMWKMAKDQEIKALDGKRYDFLER